MNDKLISQWRIHKYDSENCYSIEDTIAQERVLTIMINGEEFATLVCSPTDVNDLVVGFLAAEGVIRSSQNIQSLTFNESSGFAYVKLEQSVKAVAAPSKRMIASCCGKSREIYFQTDAKTARTIIKAPTIEATACLDLMHGLQNRSEAFAKTGGVHNAAIATEGCIKAIRTDIGRHNALDKLYGDMIKQKRRANEYVLVFSGRVSSEIVLKAAKMGIGVLLSKSSPTDLALRLAEDLNITVVGFIRNKRMNVYTVTERIVNNY